MQGSSRTDSNKRDNRAQARPSERKPSAHLVQRKGEEWEVDLGPVKKRKKSENGVVCAYSLEMTFKLH
jgi:hypothetical protein